MSASEKLKQMITDYVNQKIGRDEMARGFLRLTADRLDEVREIFKDDPDLFENLTGTMHWGTLGRQAQNAKHVRKTLRELETSHLENIMITQKHIPDYIGIVIMELIKRRHTGQAVQSPRIETQSKIESFQSDLD